LTGDGFERALAPLAQARREQTVEPARTQQSETIKTQANPFKDANCRLKIAVTETDLAIPGLIITPYSSLNRQQRQRYELRGSEDRIPVKKEKLCLSDTRPFAGADMPANCTGTYQYSQLCC
jgi:hypothetical protein